MHLKCLELSGFKSFAKKTVLDFPKGITVVAGPNGSGKSNIVDAIRWALAEQSFKNLRGKKGEDLIFYGSGQRGSLSRASVAMTFDMAGAGDLAMAEAVVAREVYKNGDNNYLINNRKVRLADTEEFLSQSRIGDSSFRVLSQGMSDKLLTLSPREFKSFIEEAAGVKEYQDKKYQAELRIRNTGENLQKIEAILAELAPRLKVLKREKDKLEKKEEYLAELKNISRELFGFRYQTMLALERRVSEKKNSLRRDLRPVTAEVAKLKDELFSFDKKNKETAELVALTNEARRLESEDNRLTKEIIMEEGKINLEQERRERKLPVSVDYLKEKIGVLLSQTRADFKGIDIDAMRNLLAAVSVGLQDLLKVIEHGVSPVQGFDALPLLKGGLEKLMTQRSEIRKKLEEATLARTKKEKAFLEERHVVLAREKLYRQKESELNALENSLRQLELEEEKIKLHKEKLHQDITGVGVISLAEILDAGAVKPRAVLASGPTLVNEPALDEKLWKLKRKVEDIGLIDSAVISEYGGVNERFQFLSKESGDLRTTLASLDGLVKDLNKQVEARYKNTLAEMSHVFGGYFRLIFGGGRAALSEARIANQKSNIKNQKNGAESISGDESDSNGENHSGVEIKLELPDKKVKGLNTLSGGERTLTSIALLFALARLRKPPVMVLDEIDAALDEANTAQFIRLVKELSRETQFIIITHNRETMRGADTLYGVSMKDGISHLLSLKLQSV